MIKKGKSWQLFEFIGNKFFITGQGEK